MRIDLEAQPVQSPAVEKGGFEDSVAVFLSVVVNVSETQFE